MLQNSRQYLEIAESNGIYSEICENVITQFKNIIKIKKSKLIQGNR